MRTVDSTFTAEKNKKENQPIQLFTLFDYDGANSDLNFAAYDDDVTFDGTVYSKFPISFSSISENNRGGIDTVQLSISNVSRAIEAYLQTYDLRGKRVRMRLVWANDLTGANNYLDDFFYIDSYSTDAQTANFILTTKFDLLVIDLPLRRYSRNYCQWEYKGTECAAASAESTCNKTVANCRARNNYSRFGGFPSINPQKTIVG
jgi:lambda family phage minor tail protein L